MKKLAAIISSLVLLALRGNDLVLVQTISCTASFMTTDNLGNLYLVVNNELKKYDANGNLLKTFSDKSQGSIAFVDAADPLKLLVYFRDFRQLMFLDNTLSIKSDPILLDQLSLLQPDLVCSSYDNGFWVYDQQDFQLSRFDKNLQLSNQSGNIVQLSGVEIKPNFLMEDGNKLYLNDPENGIFVFDKFGTYAKMLPIKNLKSFQIVDDNIIYSNSTNILMYNFKTFVQQSINLPGKESINARFEKDMFYIIDSSSVKIFSTKH